MKTRKLLFALLAITGVSVAFADVDAPLSSYNDNPTSVTQQGSGPLSQSFNSSRMYNSFNDVKTVLQNQGYIIIQTNQSATQPAPAKIVSTGTLNSYIDKLAAQYGYIWQFNQNTNTITFSAINPMLPKPIPTPAAVVQPKPVNDVSSLLPATAVATTSAAVVAGAAVEKTLVVKNTNLAESPIIINKNLVDPNNSIWTMTTSDKTIRVGLERWANKAGWQLIYRSKFDMPLEANLQIKGTFDYAINEICKASASTGHQMMAEMHDKNKVLVIYTPEN